MTSSATITPEEKIMSNSRPRWEKPKVERTGPQRYGVAGEYLKAVTGDPKSTAQSAQNSAYRVLDDYIKYSESLARGRPQDAFRSRKRGTRDYRSLAVGFFEIWTRMAETWLQILEQGGELRGGRMPDFEDFIRDREDEAEAAVDGLGEITLSVISNVPVESSIRITSREIWGAIVAHALRSVTEDVAPISTEITNEGGAHLVRINVPAKQPVGVYSGLLIDEATETPIGDVTLQILERT
jgi:hypothetical protein